jgi:hypothetical protein
MATCLLIVFMVSLPYAEPKMASQSCSAMENNTEKIDWSALKITFQTYADYPTDSNAKKVIALLPKHSHVKYTGAKEEKETHNVIYDDYQLRMLDRQVLSGDPQSVRLAFNLMAIADGGFAEELDIILGTLIRINPKLFLQGLNEYDILVERIDALVGNQGDQYVDRLKAQCYDMNLRINALRKVNDPKLKGVRDKCIESLRHQIKEYCRQ